MIDDDTKERLMDLVNKPVGLGGWLGLSWKEYNCLDFAIKFYREMGIETNASE